MKTLTVACEIARMKSPLLNLALLIALPALRILAQEEKPAPAQSPTPSALDVPPLPMPSEGKPGDLMKNRPDSSLKLGGEKTPSLMPEGINPVGKSDTTKPGYLPKGHSTYRPPTTSTDLDLRIRYRQAQRRVQDDPALQALWRQSRTARTDYVKRDVLRSYYKLMFQKMLATDKGIFPLVQDRERYTLNRLDQTRVEPTDPTDQ